MIQAETLENFYVNTPLSRAKNNHPFYEAGQLRRAKMHAARLIESVDHKKMLTPALYQLLEASFILETTDTKILAAHLKKHLLPFAPNFKKYAKFSGNRTIPKRIRFFFTTEIKALSIFKYFA